MIAAVNPRISVPFIGMVSTEILNGLRFDIDQMYTVKTIYAPPAVGPYSQGIKAGGFIFVSGQLPIEPKTGIIPDSIEEQTEQCLRNIQAILEAAGASMKNVVKTTLFIVDMDDFPRMNEIYSLFFQENAPARSTVQVSRLPKDAGIMIEAIAMA